MFRLALTLLRHRVTWRFLVVLCVALGYAGLADDLSQLEVAFGSLFSYLD